MFGFLLQRPTILTLLMCPMLVYMYVRLARREEAEVGRACGELYARYAAATPAFVPRLAQSRAGPRQQKSQGIWVTRLPVFRVQ